MEVPDNCIEGVTVDCDGDPSNGCEVSFQVMDVDPTMSLAAPFRSMVIDPDGEDDDWTGIPLIGLTVPCGDCGDPFNDNVVTQPGSVPIASDLLVAFRVSWDQGNLYLWYQASDDDIQDTGTPASRQDGFELLLDFDNDGWSDEGAHQLFFSANGDPEETMFGSVSPGLPVAEHVMRATRRTNSCYFLEVSIGAQFTQGNPGVAAAFAEGMLVGFNIATNDHDGGTRQSQIFFKDPGPNYWFAPNNPFGTLELVNPGGL